MALTRICRDPKQAAQQCGERLRLRSVFSSFTTYTLTHTHTAYSQTHTCSVHNAHGTHRTCVGCDVTLATSHVPDVDLHLFEAGRLADVTWRLVRHTVAAAHRVVIVAIAHNITHAAVDTHTHTHIRTSRSTNHMRVSVCVCARALTACPRSLHHTRHQTCSFHIWTSFCRGCCQNHHHLHVHTHTHTRVVIFLYM